MEFIQSLFSFIVVSAFLIFVGICFVALCGGVTENFMNILFPPNRKG